MGKVTNIDWTDSTWNALEGCSPVSAGCKNCYASNVAGRFGGPGQHYEDLVRLDAAGEPTHNWNGVVRLAERHLRDPLKWKPVVEHAPDCLRAGDKGNEYCGCSRSRRIFVNSMSDLFHESVPDEWIDRIFAVMALCPQHVFQVLTKRPERMLKYFTVKHLNPQKWPAEEYDVQTCIRLSMGGLLKGKTLSNGHPDVMHFFKSGQADRYGEADSRVFKEWPLKNVWLGVSVENQAAADERIPLLLQTPAALRFISAEPLLGPVDLTRVDDQGDGYYSSLDGMMCCEGRGWKEGPKLDWVICGGESGRGARPIHPDWARSLRDQCAAAGMPFFFKQWGEWAEVGGGPPHHKCNVGPDVAAPIDRTNCILSVDGHRPAAQSEMRIGTAYRWLSRVGKHAAGSLLDGREHKEFPLRRIDPLYEGLDMATKVDMAGRA